MTKRFQSTAGVDVRAEKCNSCPFQTDENGRHLDEQLVSKLQVKVLGKCAHICHQSQLDETAPTQLCRGARNFQLTIYHRLGMISEPTDAALQARTEELSCSKDS